MTYLQLRLSTLVVSMLVLVPAMGSASAQRGADRDNVPDNIKAIFHKPLYKGATWGLRVVPLDEEEPLIDLNPCQHFFIGSVRKVFSVGELLNQVGPEHHYDTPIYRQGTLSDAGVLRGNLILVASGDLTMGGRTNPDGSVAVTDFDHNEANSLGNAVLTKPDPLAGYASLARQVAASGIREINGDVVIDDRLFKPFNFRDEFNLKPIFVNDDVVDLTIEPRQEGELASVQHRPHSAALAVDNDLTMSRAGTALNINPEMPACIGQPGCTATLSGQLPVGFVPPLTNHYPMVRTFRIAEPSDYARTVLIEQLRAAGVRVNAATVEENPVKLLPARNSYRRNMRVAELEGLPYSQDAKFILKVSYNIGADTSILLYGLTQGADDMKSALEAEERNLEKHYDINPGDYFFLDGSGGGDTTATNGAVTRMLEKLHGSRAFPQFFAALPVLGVDGSLATVTDFESEPSLAPAKGRVRAKTGTLLVGTATGLVVKGQAFGGYIDARSGRKLVYQLVVNDVPVKGLPDLLQIFQDEGTISAILWRDN